MLDGLVGRAILADSDGIVGEYIDGRYLHQRGQPDGRTRVVAKDQEAGAERPNLRERKPVQNRGHRVLADSKMQVAATIAASQKVSCSLKSEPGFRRGCQIGSSANQPRHILCDRILYLGRSVSSRHSFL